MGYLPKTEKGYVSDFFQSCPTCRTSPVTMVSLVGNKTPDSDKVADIWFKE